MTVVLTADATDDLDEVWRYTARTYGSRPANEYLAFLRRVIDELATTHPHGLPVDTRPAYRYITIRRKPRGHGHIAVYEVDANTVSVTRVFHTAQDWRQMLTP